MGYNIVFSGNINIDPPLSASEKRYMDEFCASKRVLRESGPYCVPFVLEQASEKVKKDFEEKDVIDSLSPAVGQPGLWCKWAVNEKGTSIKWNGGENFYNAQIWMKYLIEHFLGTEPVSKDLEERMSFMKGHILNGIIYAIGEGSLDVWCIKVHNGEVFTSKGTWSQSASMFIKKCLEDYDYCETSDLFKLIEKKEIVWSNFEQVQSTLTDEQKKRYQVKKQLRIINGSLEEKKQLKEQAKKQKQKEGQEHEECVKRRFIDGFWQSCSVVGQIKGNGDISY